MYKGSGGHLLFSQWRQTALFYILSSIDNSAPSSCVNRSSIMNIPRDWSMAQCHISRLPFHPLENLSKGFEFNQTRQFLLCYLGGVGNWCNYGRHTLYRTLYTQVLYTRGCNCFFETSSLFAIFYSTWNESKKIKLEYIEYSSDISVAVLFFFLSSSHEKNFCLYKLLLKEKISIFNSSSSFFPLLQTS